MQVETSFLDTSTSSLVDTSAIDVSTAALIQEIVQGVKRAGNVNAPPPNQKMVGAYQGRGAFVDDSGISSHNDFFRLLIDSVEKTTVRNKFDESSEVKIALARLKARCTAVHASGKKLIFIGNGGSAAIASHMAVDFSKNGGIRSIAFNDAPTLTCLANDFGYENVFAKQLEYYASPGDLVLIISSSGKSPNILKAAEQCFVQSLDLVTLTGQNPDNTLRKLGFLNFFVNAKDYGLVELAHLTLLHSLVCVP